MTRINAGYPVEQLSTKHLIAEHRELKRIPNNISKGKAIIENIPKTFTLGKGHVKFFYNKLLFLLNRYKSIYQECVRRGYHVQDYSSCWDNVPQELMNDWEPTGDDVQIIINRIKERS